MADQSNGSTRAEGVWKNIALFLAGVLFSGAGWLVSISRDSITRTEVDQKIHEVVQRTDAQFQSVNAHLEHIDSTSVEMGKELVRIGAHLGVPGKPTPN